MTIYHTRRSLTIALAALGMTPFVGRAEDEPVLEPVPCDPSVEACPGEELCIGEGYARPDYIPCCYPLVADAERICRAPSYDPPSTTTTAPPPVVTTTTPAPVKKKRKHRRRRR